jgi:hypothetical protein
MYRDFRTPVFYGAAFSSPAMNPISDGSKSSPTLTRRRIPIREQRSPNETSPPKGVAWFRNVSEGTTCPRRRQPLCSPQEFWSCRQVTRHSGKIEKPTNRTLVVEWL